MNGLEKPWFGVSVLIGRLPYWTSLVSGDLGWSGRLICDCVARISKLDCAAALSRHRRKPLSSLSLPGHAWSAFQSVADEVLKVSWPDAPLRSELCCRQIRSRDPAPDRLHRNSKKLCSFRNGQQPLRSGQGGRWSGHDLLQLDLSERMRRTPAPPVAPRDEPAHADGPARRPFRSHDLGLPFAPAASSAALQRTCLTKSRPVSPPLARKKRA